MIKIDSPYFPHTARYAATKTSHLCTSTHTSAAIILIVLFLSSCGETDLVRKDRLPRHPDGYQQSCYYQISSSPGKRPLVVSLHSWSGSGGEKDGPLVDFCTKNNFHYLSPSFRGSNNNPKSGGSIYAVADIIDALRWMSLKCDVDTNNIFLVGCSGGGHMALLLAGQCPQLWRGVFAACPISDLRAWYEENVNTGHTQYANDIAACCGGVPGASPAVDWQYVERSPISWLFPGLPTEVAIHTGIHDGHHGSVPVSHSLLAFNRLAETIDQIPQADVDAITRSEKAPAYTPPTYDLGYGERNVMLFRKSSHVELALFDGIHEIHLPAACAFILRMYANSGQRPMSTSK